MLSLGRRLLNPPLGPLKNPYQYPGSRSPRFQQTIHSGDRRIIQQYWCSPYARGAAHRFLQLGVAMISGKQVRSRGRTLCRGNAGTKGGTSPVYQVANQINRVPIWLHRDKVLFEGRTVSVDSVIHDMESTGEVDFVNESVRTLAGNGKKGSDYKGGGSGRSQVLNSPWDVCFHTSNDTVYIAMAGQHQIWEHNTLTTVTRVLSGDGFERNLNGSSSTKTSFAQPSGISLSLDMQEIYVADSESSSIRALDLKTGGSQLLAGGDPVFSDNLFKFGDHDGTGTDVLFQHPLGVLCGKDGQIYIADSYNHKIKKLDPVSKKVVTIAGTGKAGFTDGAALSAQLSEPSGIIDVGNGRLLIADTNNNSIRYLDLDEKDPTLRTLELKDVLPPSPKSKSMRRLRRRPSTDAYTVKVDGGSSLEGNLSIRLSLPPGYHFSKEAQSKFDVETESGKEIVIEPADGILDYEGSASLHFKRTTSAPIMQRINIKVYYCKEDEVCLYQAVSFEVFFQQEQEASKQKEITLPFAVKPRTPTTSLPVFNNS